MDHKELTAKNANDAKKDGNMSFRDFSVFGGSKNELLFKKEIVILNLIQNLNFEQLCYSCVGRGITQKKAFFIKNKYRNLKKDSDI